MCGHRFGNRSFFFPGMLLFGFLLFMSFKWMPWSLIFLFLFVIPMAKRWFAENSWDDWGEANGKRKNDEYEKPKRGDDTIQTYDGETLVIKDDDGVYHV